nr:hypothetical protein [Tanacetum cinerariifolium]
VNKSAKKNEDKASEVPHGTLTTWNAGILRRKKVNLSGLSSKKRAHKEVSIPLDFENLSFSVTNPIADHALLATPTNLKEEANELAKKKKEEAIELAKKKKEEAIKLANKKKEEANELSKKKKEEAIELAKRKGEAFELAKKKKEEAIELAK